MTHPMHRPATYSSISDGRLEGMMASGFQLAQHQATAYASFTHVFMEGSARLLAEGAGIRAGDVVLDLACGTGLVARHAVALVAPSGRLVGADINPAMLAIARGSVDTRVEWVESPCESLPFDDGTFTHVICQQGFQFFPDPAAAMRETVRVLRPSGALIATVWATPGHNPYIENQLDLLAVLDPSLVASVQRATPAHADEFLRSTAEAAGFDDVEVTMLEHDVDIADFEPWFLAQTGGTPWGPTVAALTDAGRRDLASAMAERVEPYAMPDGGHRIPFRSYRLEARLPG
jgi:ubiquinone/menaquinone biosynthesis C-methylase UbiE